MKDGSLHHILKTERLYRIHVIFHGSILLIKMLLQFTTQPVHQGYIEPHACLANISADGEGELWCTTQGQFVVRGHCAKLLGMDLSQLRVTASEIGGGFGGKTVVYLEPVALARDRYTMPITMIAIEQPTNAIALQVVMFREGTNTPRLER